MAPSLSFVHDGFMVYSIFYTLVYICTPQVPLAAPIGRSTPPQTSAPSARGIRSHWIVVHVRLMHIANLWCVERRLPRASHFLTSQRKRMALQPAIFYALKRAEFRKARSARVAVSSHKCHSGRHRRRAHPHPRPEPAVLLLRRSRLFMILRAYVFMAFACL